MKPNIYLDIDGVLLINNKFAAPYADEFLQYVLTTYPDSVHWLTTHNWKGQNRTVQVLTPVLQPETIKLLTRVKSTEWGDYKTDAIDFSKPFLWFDDDLFGEEREDLIKHSSLSSFVKIDLSNNESQLLEVLNQLKNTNV